MALISRARLRAAERVDLGPQQRRGFGEVRFREAGSNQRGGTLRVMTGVGPALQQANRAAAQAPSGPKVITAATPIIA